jgi:flagellar hook-basal body complex protein FliE
MVDSINPGISPIGPKPLDPSSTGGEKKIGGKSFSDVFKEQINLVNSYLLEANIDEVFAEVKKADLQFQTLMQIRNKLMDAYEEIIRMRV